MHIRQMSGGLHRRTTSADALRLYLVMWRPHIAGLRPGLSRRRPHRRQRRHSCMPPRRNEAGWDAAFPSRPKRPRRPVACTRARPALAADRGRATRTSSPACVCPRSPRRADLARDATKTSAKGRSVTSVNPTVGSRGLIGQRLAAMRAKWTAAETLIAPAFEVHTRGFPFRRISSREPTARYRIPLRSRAYQQRFDVTRGTAPILYFAHFPCRIR